MRLLVIGLDGVNFDVLDMMSEAGVTPVLDSVRESYASGPLQSQLPPWTPSAWPSIYTGVNPGKHGVYDFFGFDGYDWDIVNRSGVKEFAVWELLSMNGFSSVVLNVPVTHPPREFDGVLVPGYIAPEDPTCHPTGVWEELQETVGDYSVYGRTLDEDASETAIAEDLVDLSVARGEAFRHLVSTRDPDFGFVQFQSTDSVFHEFPETERVRQRVFAAVDDQIGAILECCEAETVLLVSDHGMGPMDGVEFRVNDYLREHGWIETTTDGQGMPSWKGRASKEDPSVLRRTLTPLAETGVAVSARAGLTSQRISRLLERLGLKEFVLRTIPLDVIRAGAEQVDYRQSKAYMRTRTEMGIRLNLVGREPAGTVPQSEYEQVRTTLTEQLSDAETPTGDPIFEDVLPAEAVFEGPHLGDAPDIVTVPAGFDHFLVANLKGATVGEPTEPWEHKRDGLILASGRHITDGNASAALAEPSGNGTGAGATNAGADVSPDGAHIFDVAPTILRCFGLQSSDRMDGQSLVNAGPTGHREYPAFEGETVGSDATAVEKRLSDLGYLE